jgi:hypothetical protein
MIVADALCFLAGAPGINSFIAGLWKLFWS